MNCIKGVINIANASGTSLARLFGVISPNINTNVVMTTVDNVMPKSLLNHEMKRIVASEAAKMLTMLFPTKIVTRTFSKLSDNSSVFLARLLPFSIKCLSLIGLRDENAVSVAEKIADNKMSTTNTMI